MAAPGLYLHVPFCSAVCPYCDFSVLKAGRPARKRFVEHLVAEVPLAAREWKDPRPFDTVYFGGGTPSLLPPEDLERVLDACRAHLALAHALDLPGGQPRGRDARRVRRVARARGANPLSRGAVVLRRRASLPRPPPRRDAGAGRGRDRAGRGLRHRLGRPHLRPARPDARRPGGASWRRPWRSGRGTCRATSSRSTRARASVSPRSGASSPRCPRESRPSSSISRTASSPTRATPRTRSRTSRAAATTSRATTASTGTTRPTSGSAPRRTRSRSRTRVPCRRPAAGGTSCARRAGRAAWRRASGRSRARSRSARRRWRPRP